MNRATRSLLWMAPRLSLLSIVFLLFTVVGPTAKPSSKAVHEKIVAVDLSSGVATVDAGIDAEMVALSWSTGDPTSFSVRALDHGQWTDWLSLEAVANDVDGKPKHAGRTAGPAWLGNDLRTFEVRLDAGTPGATRLHALDVKSANDSASGSALGPEAADAQVPAPFIASRAQWGADESFRNMYPECTTPDYASSVDFAVVHHTVNSNTYGPGDTPALIRGIYFFHTHTNGWCDVGYNFFVDRFGQVFEGRFGGGHEAVIASHAGGFNGGSTGVALIGSFDTSPVPAATYNSLRDLLAWKLRFHGINPLGTTTHVVKESDCNCQLWPPGTVVTLPTIVGHRDVDSTGCPGQYMYDLLPQLRLDVAAIVNAPQNRDQAIVCDWNGDGKSTPALYQNGVFFIRQTNAEGGPDLRIHYGDVSYLPVCGDWNGDGVDTIGVYFNGWWYLRNSNTPGPPDVIVNFGAGGYRPVVGNWNGLKVPGVKGDGIGVYVNGTWYLRQTPSAGPAEIAPFAYGTASYRPVVGDWNGDGRDGIGVYDAGHWYLRQGPTPGAPQVTNLYGRATDRPVAGDWDDDGSDSPGVSRGSWWYEGHLDGFSAHEFPILPYV